MTSSDLCRNWIGKFYYLYRESHQKCPNCKYAWSDGIHEKMNSEFNLKKVDFIWINREQKSFEWFLQLLSKLEMEQVEEGYLENQKSQNKFLDIHLYMTSFSPSKDINAMALKLALDLMHRKVSTTYCYRKPKGLIRLALSSLKECRIQMMQKVI